MRKPRKRILCPTCKQDMRSPPREGTGGKDCPQCGQGLTKYRAGLLTKKADA
jgi:Zn-finger nucleic acid-binding protein